MGFWLLIIGGVIILLWGTAHLFPVKNIAHGFGTISKDNQYLVIMGWLSEGLFLMVIGLTILIISITGGPQTSTLKILVFLNVITLFILTGLSLFTGARTPILPIKLCPVIKSLVAILILIGTTMY